MLVHLNCFLSNNYLDSSEPFEQRHLAIQIAAAKQETLIPLNFCLILDRSRSMQGVALARVKEATYALIDRLRPQDRISVIGFNHQSQVIVDSQLVANHAAIKTSIAGLTASGGTCIDGAIKLGIQQLAKARHGMLSQACILTDGENEHGDNPRCLELANLATEYNMTFHTLGVGEKWNADVLEKIADAGRGRMVYIANPDDAVDIFGQILQRIQSVGLTNAQIWLDLFPHVQLSPRRPIAQVLPETIELEPHQEQHRIKVRLGDLLVSIDRVILVNLTVNHSVLPLGSVPLLSLQVHFECPSTRKTGLTTPIVLSAEKIKPPIGDCHPQVQQYLQLLTKYRQIRLAEMHLYHGDYGKAAQLFEAAAQTSLRLGDAKASTVLQSSATRLQTGIQPTLAEQKQVKIIGKTTPQI